MLYLFTTAPTIADVLNNIDQLNRPLASQFPLHTIFLLLSLFLLSFSFVVLFIQKKQLRRKEDEAKGLRNENNSLKEGIVTLRSKSCDLEMQIENLNVRIHQLKTENEKLNQQIEDLMLSEKERKIEIAPADEIKKPRRNFKKDIQQQGTMLFPV